MNDEVPLTQWLRAAGEGDGAAGSRAYARIYAELRTLAARQLGADRHATLTPTALVNETFLKLAGGALDRLDSRQHFFNLAARAMRQTVIDHARERLAEKRGGKLVHTTLDGVADDGFDAERALAFEQAFAALERQDAELAELLALRVFAGLDAREIAELRGGALRTVQRELSVACSYLRAALAA